MTDEIPTPDPLVDEAFEMARRSGATLYVLQPDGTYKRQEVKRLRCWIRRQQSIIHVIVGGGWMALLTGPHPAQHIRTVVEEARHLAKMDQAAESLRKSGATS